MNKKSLISCPDMLKINMYVTMCAVKQYLLTLLCFFPHNFFYYSEKRQCIIGLHASQCILYIFSNDFIFMCQQLNMEESAQEIMQQLGMSTNSRLTFQDFLHFKTQVCISYQARLTIRPFKLIKLLKYMYMLCNER